MTTDIEGAAAERAAESPGESPLDRAERVPVGGFDFVNVSRAELVEHIDHELEAGRGGWLITANTDYLVRTARDAEVAAIYQQATVVVADGKPILWASRLQGQPLVERVAGSDLVWSVAEMAPKHGRRIYLLGGDDGIAERAKGRLEELYDDIEICGVSSPWFSARPTAEEIDVVRRELTEHQPDIVYFAVSSPKQERVIVEIYREFPQIWFLGIGISLSFMVGDVKRAPRWMRSVGLEWMHRLGQQPRRLAKRYLVDDLPFALRLLWRSWRRR